MGQELLNIEELWNRMSPEVRPFPKGVADVSKPISGTAFFPGGFGLWERQDDPREKIMVVGQDFNSLKKHKQALEDGTEIYTSKTWKGLLRLFELIEPSANECFFTNVYMGLRDGGKEDGLFPGMPGVRSTPEFECFTKRCLDFFLIQLELLRPKLIFTLGLAPLRLLASRIRDIPKPTTMKACTDIYCNIPMSYGSVTLVALTHPSRYDGNVVNRRYLGESGAKAEMAMIAHGMKAAFPTDKLDAS